MNASHEIGPDNQPPVAVGGPARGVVLVGLMGAGKSSIGRRLARALKAPFADADDEIVAAAGLAIPEIFEVYGEPVFRDLERRVVARLVGRPAPGVVALGGGAFVDPGTRQRVRERCTSIWLRADLDTLLSRTVRRRGARPLLKDGDIRATLARLMGERYPIYAEADHAVDTTDEPPDAIVGRIVALLTAPAASSSAGAATPAEPSLEPGSPPHG